MEIKDLAGLSKPLTRLIEVVSNGVGSVYAPYLNRKNAEANAHKIQVIADAISNVAQQNGLPVVYQDDKIGIWEKPEDKTLILNCKPIDDRSESRLDYQSRKEQDNVENITAAAAIELAMDESVAPESPDDDWVTRFFKHAQDVSSEQMQDLWGRILAGEIRQPGTYSLRTLDFIRSMTTSEAKLFEEIGRLAITYSGTAFLDIRDAPWLETNHGIFHGSLLSLSEINLMHPSDLSLRTFCDNSIDKEHFYFHDRLLLVDRGDLRSEVRIKAWKFTNIGLEMLSLIPNNQDNDCLEKLGLHFVKQKARAFICKLDKKLVDGNEYQIVREIVSH